MAQICETHQLALAADGKCVLCRRAERPAGPLVSRRIETTGDKVVTIGLLACMVAATGALVWVLQQPAPTAQTSGDTTLASTAVAAPDVPPPIVTAADAGTTDGGPGAPKANAATTAQVEALTEGAVTRARRERIEAERAKVKVTMYATQWCSICDAARFYLQAARVDFVELRIDQDEAAAKRLERLNRAKTVPTFTVNDSVLVGYNAYEIEAKISAAARAAADKAIDDAPTGKTGKTSKTGKASKASGKKPAQ